MVRCSASPRRERKPDEPFFCVLSISTRSETAAETLVQLQQLHSISFSLFQLLRRHGGGRIRGMQAGRLRRAGAYGHLQHFHMQ